MGYHKEFSNETMKELEELWNSSKKSKIFRRVQAVYFRAKFNYSISQIAEMTGYCSSTVSGLHSSFIRNGMSIFEAPSPGGRKASYMTPEEESSFLEPFIKDGDIGSILEVSIIHKAHCERVNKSLPLSTTYRLLHRHGWRKIMPRPRRPKANLEAQASFKKLA